LFLKEHAKIEPGFLEVGLELQSRLVILMRLGHVARVVILQAALKDSHGLSGVASRSRIFARRPHAPSLLLLGCRHLSQLLARLRVIGDKPEDLLKTRGRVGEPSLRFQRLSEVHVSIDIVRLAAHGLLIARRGFLLPAHIKEHHAQVVVYFGEVGLEAKNLLIDGDGAFAVLLVLPDFAKPGEIAGDVLPARIKFQGPRVAPGCLDMLALVMQGHAQVVMGIGTILVRLDGLPEPSRRLIEPAAVGQHQASVDADLGRPLWRARHSLSTCWRTSVLKLPRIRARSL
jgi:hypothetical protein